MNKKLLAFLTICVVATSAFTAVALLNFSYGQSMSQSSVGQVYTIDNAAAGNNVWIFSHAADGSLTVSGSVSTNGTGTGSGLASQGAVILSSDNKWLIAVNAGSNEVSVFQVNGNNLTLTDKESSHGTGPISLTISNNWVYVLNNGTATTPGNIAGFQINQTGMLTYVQGSNQPLSGMLNSSPEQIGFNPNGTVLLVTEKATNLTDWYNVDSNGIASAPTVMQSVSAGPYGFAYTSTGFLVLSEAASNTLTSYNIGDNGTVRVLSGSMPTFGNAPCWVAVSQDGKYAYTSNAHGGTISGFTVSTTGMLNLFSSVSARTAVPTLDLALSNDGKFLFAINGNSISGYLVYPDGSLSNITSVNNLPNSITGLAAT